MTNNASRYVGVEFATVEGRDDDYVSESSSHVERKSVPSNNNSGSDMSIGIGIGILSLAIGGLAYLASQKDDNKPKKKKDNGA